MSRCLPMLSALPKICRLTLLRNVPDPKPHVPGVAYAPGGKTVKAAFMNGIINMGQSSGMIQEGAISANSIIERAFRSSRPALGG